jgi:hypothetical protein
MRTLKSEGLRRILVPLGLLEMQQALDSSRGHDIRVMAHAPHPASRRACDRGGELQGVPKTVCP